MQRRTNAAPKSLAVDRRQFLGAVSAVGISTLVSGSMSAQEPNRDIRIGVIGLRGRGNGHLKAFGDRVVAICDVDEQVLAGCQERLNKERPDVPVETFVDFRRLLDRQDVDAVSIATPNHTHALIAILAMQAGKHVYVEKPVSQTVWEGRQLASAARRYNRVVQCGTQSRSSTSVRKAIQYVQEGNLGAIRYALGTCYKRRPSIGKLDQPLQIPSSVDFDLWCGPVTPYPIYRPQLHYDWHWDFHTGCGDIGNQGVHQMDVARWFLGESNVAPQVITVGGRVGYEDAGDTPNSMIALFRYSTAPLLFEVRGLPAKSGSEDMDVYRDCQIGVLVQCEKGHVLVPSYFETMVFDDGGTKIEHWSGGNDQDHYQNFLHAVEAGDPQRLNAEVTEGHRSSSLCHLANIAYQTGRPLPISEISKMVADEEILSDSFARLVAHLQANGLPTESLALRFEDQLVIDPVTERPLGQHPAEQWWHRHDRREFAVPEIT